MFSNDTRKIFFQAEIFWCEKPREENERELIRQKSRRRTLLNALRDDFGSLLKESKTKFFLVFSTVFQFFLPPLFSPSILVWTASRRSPHWKSDNYALNTSTMAKRTKSARKAAKSVRRRACKWTTRERERERETLSLSSFALFLARPVVFI